MIPLIPPTILNKFSADPYFIAIIHTRGIKMIQLEKVRLILENHKAEMMKKYKVKEIGIFGSYVKNLQNKNSDLDILVDFSEPISFFQFLDLEEYLENLFHLKVDLVSKKALKPKIGENILREIAYI